MSTRLSSLRSLVMIVLSFALLTALACGAGTTAATPTVSPPPAAAATATPPAAPAPSPTPAASTLPGFSRFELPPLESVDVSFPSGVSLDSDQTLTFVYPGQPREQVVPPYREGGNDRAYYWWVFMPPFHTASIDNNFELRQGLATGYSVSDDGQSYLLHLDPRAVFHDGTPLTAADVKKAWEVAAWPENQVAWGAILLHSNLIEGMSAVSTGDATEASGMTAIDDHTLRIDLTEESPTWPLQLAIWMFGVYKADQLVSDPDGFRTNPIGVGPFQGSYDTASGTENYARNVNWWRDMPTITSINRPAIPDLQTNYIMYENGELDIMFADSTRQPAVHRSTNPYHSDLVQRGSAGLWYAALVTDIPPFDDLNVRKAFAHAVDVGNVVNAVLSDTDMRAEGPVVPGAPCYQPGLAYSYDPALAQQALSESSYGSAANIPQITVALSRPEIIRMFEIFQEQWRDNLGISINIVRLEPGMQAPAVVHMRRQSLGARIPDVVGILNDMGSSESSVVRNGAKFVNPELDAMLAEARRLALDAPNRCEVMQNINGEILDEYYYLPLHAGSKATMAVQPWVVGFKASWDEMWNTLPWMQIGQRNRAAYGR